MGCIVYCEVPMMKFLYAVKIIVTGLLSYAAMCELITNYIDNLHLNCVVYRKDVTPYLFPHCK